MWSAEGPVSPAVSAQVASMVTELTHRCLQRHQESPAEAGRWCSWSQLSPAGIAEPSRDFWAIESEVRHWACDIPTADWCARENLCRVIICTMKKAERWRIDAFELCCWRRLLRVSWTYIKPVNPKGNQPWICIGRLDAETETPILWLPDAKSQLFGKDPDAGKEWRQKNRAAEDEAVR